MSNDFLETYFILLDIIRQIKQEQTGNPEEFRKKMNISEHQFYNYISILEGLGCRVKYNRKLKTYFFINGCKLKDLSADE